MSSMQVNFVQRTPIEVMEDMDDKFQIVLDIRRMMALNRKAKMGTVSLIKFKNEYNKIYERYEKVLALQGYTLHKLDTVEDRAYMIRLNKRLIQLLCKIIPEEII